MVCTIRLSAFVFGVATAVTAQNNFAYSCTTLSLSSHYLTGQCYQENGGIRSTTMDLNLCVTNNNGNLAAQNYGGYYGSCDSCTGFDEAGEPQMSCECGNNSGIIAQYAQIDLNSFLGNSDGHLVCFTHYGTKRDIPASNDAAIKRELDDGSNNATYTWTFPNAKPPTRRVKFTA